MIISREYTCTPGATSLWHPTLNGIRVLGVKREGVGLTEVALLTQTNRQFSHGLSRIYVDPSQPFNVGEKIWVLYEE